MAKWVLTVITIGACEGHHQLEHSLEVFRTMQRVGVVPAVAACNASAGARETGRQLEPALDHSEPCSRKAWC